MLQDWRRDAVGRLTFCRTEAGTQQAALLIAGQEQGHSRQAYLLQDRRMDAVGRLAYYRTEG